MNKTNNSMLLTYFSMIYISVMLTSAIMTSKIISIGPVITLAGALVVPIIFSLTDIIAELYGYITATKIVLFAFFCQMLFSFLCYSINHLPSPSYWHGQLAYQFVLSPLFRISLASFLAYSLSSITNIYLLTYWKKLWRGKLFVLRSIGSSTLGELLFTFLAVMLIFAGKDTLHHLMEIALTSYFLKVLGTIIMSIFSGIFVNTIKKNGIHKSKTNKPFNPFKPTKLTAIK